MEIFNPLNIICLVDENQDVQAFICEGHHDLKNFEYECTKYDERLSLYNTRHVFVKKTIGNGISNLGYDIVNSDDVGSFAVTWADVVT